MDEKVTFSDDFPVVDGIRTHVRIAGAGTPMLLVHGLGGPIAWSRVSQRLAELFRVIIVDLPGFGDSDAVPARLSTVQHAEFLVHLLRTLGTEAAFIVGISYGGQVAATLASRYPEACLFLCLISSTGFLRNRALAGNRLLRGMFDTVVRRVVLPSRTLTCLLSRHAFHRLPRRPQEYCAVFHREMMRPGAPDAWLNAFHNVVAPDDDFPAMLRTIRVPTLILWGEHDRSVPPHHGRLFRQSIPEAELRMLAECAHAVPLEAPEEVAGALESFFVSSSPSPRR